MKMKDTDIPGPAPVGTKVVIDLLDFISFELIEDNQENRDCVEFSINGVLGNGTATLVGSTLCYEVAADDASQPHGYVWIDITADYKGDMSLANVAIQLT